MLAIHIKFPLLLLISNISLVHLSQLINQCWYISSINWGLCFIPISLAFAVYFPFSVPASHPGFHIVFSQHVSLRLPVGLTVLRRTGQAFSTVPYLGLVCSFSHEWNEVMGFGRKATGEGAVFITLFWVHIINLTLPFDVDLDYQAELSRFFTVELLSLTSPFHTVLFGRKLLCSDHIALRRDCLHKLAGIFLNGRLALLLLSTQQILLCHFFLMPVRQVWNCGRRWSQRKDR